MKHLLPKRTVRKTYFVPADTEFGKLLDTLMGEDNLKKIAKWKLLRLIHANRKAKIQSLITGENLELICSLAGQMVPEFVEKGTQAVKDLDVLVNFPFEIGGGVMALYAEGLPVEVINVARKKLGLPEAKETSGKAVAVVVNGGKCTLVGGAADAIVARTKNGLTIDTEDMNAASTREIREEWGEAGNPIADHLEKVIPSAPGHYLVGIEDYLATGNPNHVTAGSFIRPYDLLDVPGMTVSDLTDSIMSGKAGSEEGKVVFIDLDIVRELGGDSGRIFSIHYDWMQEHFFVEKESR